MDLLNGTIRTLKFKSLYTTIGNPPQNDSLFTSATFISAANVTNNCEFQV